MIFLATKSVLYEDAHEFVSQRSTVQFLDGNLTLTEPDEYGKTDRADWVFPPLERDSDFDKNFDTIPRSHATRYSGK